MPKKFKPKPYTFTLTDIFDKPLILDEHRRGNIIAQCPPFHILLDHTIAVLWIVFSEKKQALLRSAQISWALRFLEGMTNDSRNKAYAEDIDKSIKMLECILINCIAEEKTLNASDGGESTSSSSEDEEEEKEQAPDITPTPPRKRTLESLIFRELD